MRTWGSWTRVLVMGGGLAGLGGGCATAGANGVTVASRPGERELRGSVVVSGARARSALAGPLHLLHVDYEARGTVELYSVARRDGSDADCAGPALMRLRLHGRRPNAIDADVGANEVVCLVAEKGAAQSAVSVSFHAAPSETERPRTLAAAFPLSR